MLDSQENKEGQLRLELHHSEKANYRFETQILVLQEKIDKLTEHVATLEKRNQEKNRHLAIVLKEKERY